MPSAEKAPTFVVGATGTVGRRLTRQLADEGRPVRAATRHPDRYDGPAAAEPVRFDMTDPSTHASALEGAESVFLMAPSDTDAYGQLVPFIDAAADTGVERVALMTAMGVDQAPDEMPLRAAELHLRKSDLAGTILRPNWFDQNFLTYWRGMIENDGVLRLPAGEAETSFIDAGDIAGVAAAALTDTGGAHDGEGYTLTGPEALTYHEAADVLSEAWDRNIRYEPTSDEEALRLLTEVGLDEDYAEMLIGLFQNVRAVPVTCSTVGVTGAA